MRRHLFDPVGMNRTAFIAGGTSERRATGHEVTTDGPVPARPLTARARTFVADPADPDNPTVTFGAFDSCGRPQMLYDILWGLPRLGG